MSTKLMVLGLFLVSQSVCALAEIVRWDASSGVLPSDPSIPADQRFTLIGEASFLSFQDGALNFNDTSTSSQVSFRKYDLVPTSESDWAFQITMRMNKSVFPGWYGGYVGSCWWEGDVWGLDTGITIGEKSILMEINYDGVMLARCPWNGYSMDTMDDFHTYRVTKASGMVNLYVDSFDTPVISVPYSDFHCDNDQTAGGFVDLARSLDHCLPDFDVLNFAYNTDGTSIEKTPLEQIAEILEFMDMSVVDGTLEGTGPGHSGDKRLNALRNMIGNAGNLVDDGLIPEACRQLMDAHARTDGQPAPADFVAGPAAEELAAKIQGVINSLGCE